MCNMMRKGKSGKFEPSDDLCTGLEKVGGTRRDWKVEFEAIKKGHVKAAFDKIGIFFDKVDGKQVPLGVIKCVADNTSIWGMGRPGNADPYILGSFEGGSTAAEAVRGSPVGNPARSSVENCAEICNEARFGDNAGSPTIAGRASRVSNRTSKGVHSRSIQNSP